MDIGPRLKLARTKAQMSIRELAEQVGVSATAISKFERGVATPRQSTLLRLAKALSVSIEYFFREIKVETLAPAYRKHSKLNKRSQEGLEASITEAVERYLAAEQVFPYGFFPEAELPRFEANEAADAELAATKLRETWNLGSDPIEDLSGRLENRGVKLLALDASKGFDGFSCWANNHIPIIAFNNKVPGDRQRFSIAHELGHLVLDHLGSPNIETLAHRFAGAFLVTAQSAYSELGRKRSNLSFDELLMLKHEYGVSIQAWIRRAYDLGIIDRSTYSELCKRLSARGWRVQEPGEVPREEPRRLRLLVHQALAENLITPSFAAKLLGELPQGKPKFAAGELPEPTDVLAREYAENQELTAFADADPEVCHETDR